MAISFVGVSNAAAEVTGNSSANNAAITPTKPSGTVDGDLLVVLYSSIFTPNSVVAWSGFADTGNPYTGFSTGTPFSTGTGQRRLSAWAREDVGGAVPMPTITSASTANNAAVAIVLAFRKDPTERWVRTTQGRWMSQVGEANHSGTASSTPTLNDPSIGSFDPVKDWLIMVTVWNDGPLTTTHNSLTPASGSYAPHINKRADGGTNLGFDISMAAFTAEGTGSLVTHPTGLNWGVTASGSTQGGMLMFRIATERIETGAQVYQNGSWTRTPTRRWDGTQWVAVKPKRFVHDGAFDLGWF